MPAVMKPEVMHVSREDATFVNVKPKVVFRFFRPMDGENMHKKGVCLV